MKKLLSIILVGILAVSSFILTTFATENEKSETEIEREKLGWLLDAFKILNTNIGEARIYNCVAGDTYNDAYNLYNQDELATAEEYKNMKDKLYSAAYNLHVDVAYAKTAYDNACKEQNYNNWYSDEQWNEFQYKLADLKTDLEPYIAGTNDYDVWAITNAYNELLAVYNKMTNAYTLKGDVNKDGVVNVVDATLIQKYIAHEVEFTGAQKMLTNVYDACMAEPGTILSYSIGYYQICDLEEEVKEMLGESFDHNEFVTELLSVGGASFDITRSYIMEWANEKLHG